MCKESSAAGKNLTELNLPLSKVKFELGQKIGNWAVVDPEVRARVDIGKRGRKIRYHVYCQCTCGKHDWVFAENLHRGLSSSCGCIPRGRFIAAGTKHGKSKSPIYAVWNMMQQRIRVPTNKQYADYGGRGLDMDPRWFSFEVFYAEMGDPPFAGASLERINNERGYWPDNVKWATREEQSRNKRNTHLFEFKGHSLILKDWAKVIGINEKSLSTRIYLCKWSIERALTEKVNGCHQLREVPEDPAEIEIILNQ